MVIEAESLHRLGLPALTVNEHGRIVSWNRYAADFFRLESDVAIGCEWHTVVRSIKALECCALCRTRQALRQGEAVCPLDITLVIHGCLQRVVMVPVPTSADAAGDINFLIIDQKLASVLNPASEPPLDSGLRVRYLDSDHMIDRLTQRERDILACVVEGLDARGIAATLGISHATARNYVQRILAKLGVRNKAEAVRIALTYGLLAS